MPNEEDDPRLAARLRRLNAQVNRQILAREKPEPTT
jgi:hypothetical protein